MLEREIIIVAEEGLHARPAADFVKKAMSFKDTDIKVIKDGKEVNAKSMMSVLSLGAASGSTILIKADGPDEENAVNTLESILV